MAGYILIRSKRRKKTIDLQVRGDGEVVIRAPWSAGAREIAAFFSSKERWIERRIAKRKEGATDFWSGKRLLYRGKYHPFEVLPQEGLPESFFLSDRRFYLRCDRPHRIPAIITTWLAGQAESYFRKRLAYNESLTGHRSSGFRLSDAKYRWGSCSPRNRLSLNWRLVMAPPDVLDYVIVHELMHITEKNHSANFWRLVADVITDYGERRQWLKENAFVLSL